MNDKTGVRKRTLLVRYRSGLLRACITLPGKWINKRDLGAGYQNFSRPRESVYDAKDSLWRTNFKLTLLLIYFNREKNFDTVHPTSKGYDFDTLNVLEEKGYTVKAKPLNRFTIEMAKSNLK